MQESLAVRACVVALVLALGALAFAACNQPPNGSGAEDSAVAGTVNGRNIMLGEFDRVIAQQTNGQQSQLSQLEQAAARLQVLDNLIKQEAMFQRAEKE